MREQIIERIPTAQIHIANPRRRSRAKWQMLVANIREVGPRKPITVGRRYGPDTDGIQFDLVCGQGRIEAFVALGETPIPAAITEASREDQFLMSLVENIARRPPTNRDSRITQDIYQQAVSEEKRAAQDLVFRGLLEGCSTRHPSAPSKTG